MPSESQARPYTLLVDVDVPKMFSPLNFVSAVPTTVVMMPVLVVIFLICLLSKSEKNISPNTSNMISFGLLIPARVARPPSPLRALVLLPPATVVMIHVILSTVLMRLFLESHMNL